MDTTLIPEEIQTQDAEMNLKIAEAFTQAARNLGGEFIKTIHASRSMSFRSEKQNRISITASILTTEHAGDAPEHLCSPFNGVVLSSTTLDDFLSLEDAQNQDSGYGIYVAMKTHARNCGIASMQGYQPSEGDRQRDRNQFDASFISIAAQDLMMGVLSFITHIYRASHGLARVGLKVETVGYEDGALGTVVSGYLAMGKHLIRICTEYEPNFFEGEGHLTQEKDFHILSCSRIGNMWLATLDDHDLTAADRRMRDPETGYWPSTVAKSMLDKALDDLDIELRTISLQEINAAGLPSFDTVIAQIQKLILDRYVNPSEQPQYMKDYYMSSLLAALKGCLQAAFLQARARVQVRHGRRMNNITRLLNQQIADL